MSVYYQTSPPVSPPPRAYYTPGTGRFSTYSGRSSYGDYPRPYSAYSAAQPAYSYYAPTYTVGTAPVVTAVQPAYSTPMTYSYVPRRLSRYYRRNGYGSSYSYGQGYDDGCCSCCGGDGGGCCDCCGPRYYPYTRYRRQDDCC